MSEIIKKYDVTREFLDQFFPSIEQIEKINPEIPYANNIIYHSLIAFGFPASGKTTLCNTLAGYARDKYGDKNVNAMFSEKGNLQAILDNFKPKLVNILYTDNATLAEYDKKTIHDYFMLRNITAKKFGITQGYILSIIALHRYFAIPIEFRSIIDGMILRDVSLNPYDNNVIKKFISNDELHKLLKELSVDRNKHRKLMNFSIFVGKTLKGVLCLPPRREFYFNEPASPMGDIPMWRFEDINKVIEEHGGYHNKEKQ